MRPHGTRFGFSLALVILLIFSFSPSISRTTSLREYFRPTRIEWRNKESLLKMLFNEFWPKPSLKGVIANKEPRDGRVIPQGILFVEMARRPGDGSMPPSDAYRTIAFELFSNLRPGQSKNLSIGVPIDGWDSGVYWVRQTLRIYTHQPSTILEEYEKIARHKNKAMLSFWTGLNIMNGRWKEERVLGAEEIQFEPVLLSWEKFWSISGLSIIGIFCFLFFVLKRFLPKFKFVGRQVT